MHLRVRPLGLLSPSAESKELEFGDVTFGNTRTTFWRSHSERHKKQGERQIRDIFQQSSPYQGEKCKSMSLDRLAKKVSKPARADRQFFAPFPSRLRRAAWVATIIDNILYDCEINKITVHVADGEEGDVFIMDFPETFVKRFAYTLMPS